MGIGLVFSGRPSRVGPGRGVRPDGLWSGVGDGPVVGGRRSSAGLGGARGSMMWWAWHHRGSASQSMQPRSRAMRARHWSLVAVRTVAP